MKAALAAPLTVNFFFRAHLKSFLTLLFFLFPLASYGSNNIAINSWQENTNLTATGKISEILAQGKVKNLPQNQIMTSFSISFDKSRHLKIIEVICDSKDAKFSFQNQTLKIDFSKGKNNGDGFLIYFSFDEKYDQVDKFLRQEIIDIPNFAAGANSRISINFPGYLESATLNPNLKKEANSFIYSNIVPSQGVHEIIKLTPVQNIWDVTVKAKITAPEGLNNATVVLPTYFQSGGQKVENFQITSSTQPIKQDLSTDKKILKFKTANRSILIENKARISTGKNFRQAIARDPNDYLKVDPNDLALLTPILENIKRDSKYGDIALYAKIGKYVHDLIRYDESYIGKLPSIVEIIQNPVGVCSEYAKLFNVLARIAKIPAVSIDGAACGEGNKCVGHAWNAIYHEGKWIEVDPTWDLMSGVVSSSHVYFNEEGKGGVLVQYFDNKESVASEIDFEMKEVQLN
jgi:transglutaminase-like putative cysteine protease